MKKLKWVIAGLVILAMVMGENGKGQSLPSIRYAFSDINVSLESATDLQTLLEAVTNTPSTSFDSLPKNRFNQVIATGFWSMQNPCWPPLPGDVLGLPLWEISPGRFIIDDRDVDYAALQAAAALAAEMDAAASLRMRTSTMMSSLASYAYNNQVYLTNLTTSFAYDGSVTANFNLAGGTNNFIPWDILESTNLAAPVANWNWCGLGYTTNHYTFYEQPANAGFYILAKPSKTMVVPWGDDIYGQCDIWNGLTNAVQVTGGIEFSLALLNNGTVVGWGYDGVSSSDLVPTNLVGVTMIASGWEHNVALLTNGTVTAWGDDFWGEINVPAGLSNVTVISAQALHSLALKTNGTVVAWGYGLEGETNVPVGLSNVTAISAGGEHNLVVSNGFVVAWGYNSFGQCNVPTGLSNVWDVAAGWEHSVALKKNGTVICWGDNSYGESTVPAGLSNVVAIAAGGDPETDSGYSLALKSDGTVVAWGNGYVLNPIGGMSNVIALGTGAAHALAIRTGPRTPVITLEPTDQNQAVGGNVAFNVEGQGLYGVTYQWQTNGVNLLGATNAMLLLTNVQMAQAGSYDAVVTDNAGMGSIVSSNASLYLITPPVITYQSTPTNIVCIYGNIISFAATASAPGQFNGFPLSYQWQFNGTNIAGATTTNYSFTVNDTNGGVYSFVASNAAGSTNVSWLVTVTNAINVTNDLLLVYNSNSADSSNLCAYYLAHRPMVGGANVLGVACDVGEFTSSNNCDAQIVAPVLNWLTNNPAKRPQYVVLFYDIPTRLTNSPHDYHVYGSISYHLHSVRSDWQPFVNNINAGSLADCEAYVDKIASIGSNYSPGQLIISAGSYGNTNYVVDNARHGLGYGNIGITNYGDGDFTGSGYVVSNAVVGLSASGVSPSAIVYNDGLDTNGVAGYTSYTAPQITGATNVAGYICWGEHSALGGSYPTNNTVNWSGHSGWWIIETIESFNGQRVPYSWQGNFIQWFSSNAFGGTNYSNTPIGAVSHTEEPSLGGVENSSTYFGLWAAGKNFAICAWSSRQTPYFQAVGDPLITH